MFEVYLNEIIDFSRGSYDEIDFEVIVDEYLEYKRAQYLSMSNHHLSKVLISEFNHLIRSHYKSSELIGFKVRVGDICYVDFGDAYINEAGYQHFGIIVGYCNSKALIVPMSSNYSMYTQSYCERDYPVGKRHLYRLPTIPGLNRKSVLFLNDIKYINTARIIEVKGHLSPKSHLFKDIISRIDSLI